MYDRVPYLLHISRTATAAATYVIQSPPLAAGDTLRIECVSYTNEDTNSKDIVVGVRQGTTDVWLATIAGGDKGDYATFSASFTIRSEDRLIFKVVDPAAGDLTVINVVGYFLKVGFAPGEV